MKYNYILNLILISIFFFSCNNSNSNKNSIESFFENADTLKGDILIEPINIFKNAARLYTFKNRIVLSSQINDGIIQVIDTSSGRTLMTYGKLGRGPNEFLNPVGFSMNRESNTFFIWDFYKNELTSYLLNDSINKSKAYTKINLIIQDLKAINDTTFAILTFCPDQSLGIIDTNGKFLSRFRYRVINDTRIDYDIDYNNAYINISPNKKYLAVACNQFANIQLFSIENNKLNKIWDINYSKFYYSIKDKKLYRKNRQHVGFESLNISDKFIYVTACDITVGEQRELKNYEEAAVYLLKFDLDGNFIKSYKFDNRISNITFSPDYKSIFGTITDEDTYIYKFMLK